MSRMGPPVIAAIALTASPAIGQPESLPHADVAAMMAAQRDELGVEDTECEQSDRLIVVCGSHNENDRYRLPIDTVHPGDPANEGVWAERHRIQHEPDLCEGVRRDRMQCGFVGVGFGIGGPNPGFRLGGFRRAGD